MATMTSVRVAESLQTLIDSRLDTIERMLLGRLPRAQRLEIVREVESQIFDLLQERTSDEPSREDVLAVLARLDPPEAYLPEETGETIAHPRPLVGMARTAQTQAGGARRRTALASGILGIVTIVLLLLMFPLVLGLSNLNLGVLLIVFWYTAAAIALVGSVTTVGLAIYSRLQGHWAITGLILGIIDLIWSAGFVVLGMFL